MKYGIASLVLLSACTDYGLRDPKTITDESTVRGDLDIVVFVDTSDSMQDQIDMLSDNFVRVVSRLEEAKSDWHLIAVTGPDGCGQGGVITSEDADWEQKFTDAINTRPGEDLVDEWGLYDASEAIGTDALNGCNAGFLRDEAYLHVVFISDEPDHSQGWDSGNPDYWQTYVDKFQATKPDPNMVKLSGVGGPAPIGCEFTDFSAGYYDAVMATGGDFLSICDDWPAQLDALANNAVTQLDFRLSQEPIQDSLKVYVDGAERISGWSYDEGHMQVEFQENPPYAGQQVTIEYQSVGA